MSSEKKAKSETADARSAAETKPSRKRAAAKKSVPAVATPDQSAPAVVIDGVRYAIDSLSELARQQLVNLRAAEAELEHLKQRLAITQTARMAYAAALQQSLPKP